MLRKLKRNLRVMALFSYLDRLKDEGELNDFLLRISPDSIIVYIYPREYFERWQEVANQIHGMLPGMISYGPYEFHWSWK